MMDQQQEIAQRIRELGFRLTPQRQMILDILSTLDRHATATEIYDRVQAVSPAVNRATVYRTLNFLCEIRVLVAGDITGKTVYEIADPTPHHHLVCTACKHVTVLGDHHFEELAAHLLVEHDFLADIDHLTIHGMCQPCRSAAEG